MGRLIGFDAAAITAAVQDQLVDIATDIAEEVRPHYPTVEVEVDDGTVSVTTYGSFDHLKEWGSIHNAPAAHMRQAAAKRGNYRPEGK